MGVLLLLVGLGVLAFGVMNHFKGKRILAAPFKKTGELARNPISEDPKGAMSTEGKVIAPAQALLSPCSKKECLSYEVKIERIYEKSETTQDGTKTVKGTETLDTVRGGAVFALDDGSGAIAVDVTKGADFDTMKDGYKKELNGRSWASSVQFGELSWDVPPISSSETWTIGFKATERYAPVEGNLFVLGKLEGAKIIKPGWRSMMASSKGREGLLGSIQKRKKFSFIGGGVAAVLSIPLMIWGPQGDASADTHCKKELAGVTSKCDDNVRTKDGNSYTWSVAKAGKYELQVTPPSGKKFPLDPQIVVKDAKGELVVDQIGEAPGKAAVALIDRLEPGTYTVTVRDSGGMEVKGGFDFDLEIRSDAVAGPGAVANGALRLSTDDLYADWAKDEEAGDAKYKGKTMFIQGEVATELDQGEGKATLSLKTKDLGKLVIVTFKDAANEGKAAQAKSGKTFAATCTGQMFMLAAMLENCTVEAVDPTIVAATEKLASGEALASSDTAAFLNEYKKDRKAADAKYVGQTVILKGQVNDVDRNLDDKQYVTLASKLPFTAQAIFPASTEKDAARLKKNQQVALKCRVRELGMFDSDDSNVMLEGCAIDGPVGKNVAAAPVKAAPKAKKK